MSRSFRSISTLLFAFTVGACTTPPPPPAQDTAADAAAIVKLRSGFAAALNAGDVAKVVDLYASDAIMLEENQPAIAGHDAILAHYQGLMAQATPEIVLSSDETQIGPVWAFDRGQYTFTLTPKAKGAEPMVEHGKYIVLVQKQGDGSWKLAREIGNSSDPMPAPAAAKAAKPAAKSK